MGPLQEIGTLILQTLGSLYLMVVMLRFLLQVARADFYNPMSQFIVKATNPVVIPVRRVVPGVLGVDIASIVIALALLFGLIELSELVIQGQLQNPLLVLFWSLIGCVGLIANIYFYGLIIMVIASWVAPQSSNPALILIHQLIEPVMSPIRKILPDMGGIDISPIFAFLLLKVGFVLIDAAATYFHMSLFSRYLVLGI
ncbi:MAG: YggT family protein [Cellvibrionaceae bacterium]